MEGDGAVWWRGRGEDRVLQDLVAKGFVFCVAKVELDPDGGGWGAQTHLHRMFNPQVIT